MAARRGPSPSRRLLAVALVLLIPVVGPVLAYLVRRVRGGGVALEPVDALSEPRPSADDIGRLGELPTVLDRLLCGDQAERLAALIALSSAGDAAAVAVLRWTIDNGPPEVVLDAALTLEEIDLRREHHLVASRQALAATPTVELALATAQAAAGGLFSRIADAAIAPTLAREARDCYQLALACAPERAVEIEESMARLELAAACPRAALAILDRLAGRERAQLDRVGPLRDAAAFAAREFAEVLLMPSSHEPARPVAVMRSGEIEITPVRDSTASQQG